MAPAAWTARGRVTATVVAAAVLVSGLVGVRLLNRDGPSIAPPAGLAYTDPDVINPMRGQFDNILTGLFPQSNAAQAALADWPGSRDAAIRLTWRSLQPIDPATLPLDASDDQRYDFDALDRALDGYASQGMRLSLRVSAYDSCCEQLEPGDFNIAVPDWLAARPGAVGAYDRDGVTQVIPNWDSEPYLTGFTELLAALGRRYDGDERLAVFEMSGYGDFSENVLAVLRDELGVPGPLEQDSEAELGYYSQYRDHFITAASIERLVAANLRAFPRTQMVTAPGNPQIVKQLMRDSAALVGIAHPVGVRADCLGVDEVLPTWASNRYSEYVRRDDPIIGVLRDRLRQAPVMTEWCQLPAGMSSRSYYGRALAVVLDQHVSMTASSGFPDQFSRRDMDPELYELWRLSNVYAGYRYTAGAELSMESGSMRASVRWANLGVNSTHERWAVSYQLRDRSGDVVASVDSGLDLRELDTDHHSDDTTPTVATMSEQVNFRGEFAPGDYSMTVRVQWAEHKPNASRTVDFEPMNLAMAGRVDGAYPIAKVRVS